MGQLEVEAINAQRDTGWRGWALAMVWYTRWDLTCGFCRRPFASNLFGAATALDCPHCGTRNLLPVLRFPRGG
jgi:DNA-directed RNA polymerase subunit RPC12/RpoP